MLTYGVSCCKLTIGDSLARVVALYVNLDTFNNAVTQRAGSETLEQM